MTVVLVYSANVIVSSNHIKLNSVDDDDYDNDFSGRVVRRLDYKVTDSGFHS